MAHSPLHFPPALPISARVTDIAQAIDQHQVVIVAGATGSGKTTQLPKIALAMGRGLEKVIGVTQPRRIAATSVAARVAEELGSPLGTDVGYQIRFDDKTSPTTYVKFMTDGILLAEIQGDPLLRRYDTIIIDEAHERTLTIDFLLGWVKRILPERPDLKVVVSSATLETDRFAQFFGNAPIIEVEGRTFPVDVLYEPPEEDADLPDAVARAVESITSLDPEGDILVFLPGEREIKECENELNARRLRHTVIMPLYARLSAGEQHRVFASIPQRRVILATNVAETSITIPGIVYVVDTGIARLSRYDPRSGTTRLQIEAISRASADQRKGRCGRVRDGICVRLYDEQSFASRPAFTDPEIKRTGLAGVILRMKSLRLGDVEAFPFLDPPHAKAIHDGYRTLTELGAIDDSPKKELTKLGHQLARFPIDPRMGRMILAGAEQGCLAEVLIVAAALNVQDPRERPREHQQKADELHRRFRDDRSDFVGLLRLWTFVKEAQKKGSSALRRTCRENFLSFMRVREWMEIHRQLEQISREIGIVPKAAQAGNNAKVEVEHADSLHRALLSGLLSKIGKYKPEDRVYVGAKQTRFLIHPSSGLAKKTHEWVMAVELVETTQLFARMVAKIEPEWLIDIGDHLLKRSYADPHWSEKSARASVKEHITLFGLPVTGKDRHVDYANIEPAAARKIFLEHALVRGEYKTKAAFQAKNQELLGEVALLRAKARKSDMLADDDALLAFFDRVVPDSIVNGKTFEAWREKAERDNPKLLLLSIDDVLVGEEMLRPEDFPDHVVLRGVKLALSYVFDPSLDNDGITITVPLVLLPQLDPGELDWTIRGWMEEKIAALLFELPRAVRKEIVPSDNAVHVRDLAKRLAKRKELVVPFDGLMLPKLAKAIVEETGTSAVIDADDFRMDAIAAYLRLNCRVVDESGRVLGESRDVDALWERFGAQARALWSEKSKTDAGKTKAQSETKWERTKVMSWDFGDVPKFVVRRVGNLDVRSYPAIKDQGQAWVDLVLVESEEAAEEMTRGGVRRLLALATKQTLSAITPRLPQAFAHPSGAMPSRAETESFRSALVLRVIDLAFELETLEPLPRSKRDFDVLVARGLPRIEAAAKVLTNALAPVAIELDKTLRALKNASKHPSGRHAIDDIYAQLAHLFPSDLVTWIPLPRLDHYPRYLKAAQARLQRAISDPRKDADKQAPMHPLWLQFLEKSPRTKDKESTMSLRWAFEELRVSIFAPELKTPFPINVTKIKEALTTLR